MFLYFIVFVFLNTSSTNNSKIRMIWRRLPVNIQSLLTVLNQNSSFFELFIFIFYFQKPFNRIGSRSCVVILKKFRVNDVDKRIRVGLDRKSTRLNSSHVRISYAVFCLKKK